MSFNQEKVQQEVVRFQKEIDEEVKGLQAIQKEMQGYGQSRQKLVEQETESSLVKTQFDKLESDAKVYKLVGNILVNQSHDESNQTIQKRLDYIKNELQRIEGLIKEGENKALQKREKIQKIQETYYRFMQAQQQAMQEAVKKAQEGDTSQLSPEQLQVLQQQMAQMQLNNINQQQQQKK
ncbi:Prefoldin [Pseudocohnilembus persalinus]|uniref:Prefoldin n=1 Tax=Pseudocohnilembus persalinus TaxID=266149 RepID=A0A0V0QIP2_PSEPJ|nr:Prefoldin [Pseudocohnilembus persalinus]|eukprot:KRX02089.1 Prefoldin [Pseudocohnilembus persalinus]